MSLFLKRSHPIIRLIHWWSKSPTVSFIHISLASIQAPWVSRLKQCNVIKPQNGSVEKDLQDHFIPTSSHEQGHFPLDQVGPSPSNPAKNRRMGHSQLPWPCCSSIWLLSQQMISNIWLEFSIGGNLALDGRVHAVPPLALWSPHISHTPHACSTLFLKQQILTHDSSKVFLYAEVIKSVQFKVSGSEFLCKLNSFRGCDTAPPVWSAQGTGARHSWDKKWWK